MNANTNTKQATRDRLNGLAEKRNALLSALEKSATIRPVFEQTAHELCDTMAQIATYKTLLKLSDGAKDITQKGADMCAEMLRAFPFDLRIWKTGDTSANYSDAMDIYSTAYGELWQIFNTSAPLTLTDTVYTKVLKNGNEKNYTAFQMACKGIREYIHSWSKSQDFKRIRYIIGYTDNGEEITSAQKPVDDLTDITDTDRARLFNKYGLTADERKTAVLMINGEKPNTIAVLLNISPRTARERVQKVKAKFATANLYAEYITAKNAEKVARAKAEKHTADRLYLELYEQAKKRTQKARDEWARAFHRANKTE